MARGNRSRPAHERTTEERERDRLERERRRAGRTGRDVPAPGLPDGDVFEEAEQAPALPPAPLPAEALDAPEQAMAPETSEPAIAPRMPEHAPAEPKPEPEPGGGEPDARESSATDVAVDHDESELPPWEVRSGGDSAAQPRPNLVVGEPERQGPRALGARAPMPGLGGGRGGRGGKRFTRARGAALLALAAAVALVWFLVSLFQPFAGSGSGRVIVVIPKGSSASKVGSILARDGVVSSGFFFDLRALLEGKRSSLHSGRFQLRRDMSYSAAIDALSKPAPRAIAVKVVIPEGYTRRQIADLVAEDSLSGDYLSATKSSSRLDPAHYGAPANTPSLEGFLFPATYELTAGTPVTRLLDDQLAAFRERFGPGDVRRAHRLHVTPYQLLTVASMVEREAQTDHDRPLIAAVIYNRLRKGMPLGIDATIYYAVELQKGIATYAGELSESQLKIDSPYNTRTHKGLPPTPIANPGEAAIEAAAHPAHVSYLYYVAAADGCGEQAFSDTYAQFQKHVAAYQAAVKKNGGHAPKCKKK